MNSDPKFDPYAFERQRFARDPGHVPDAGRRGGDFLDRRTRPGWLVRGRVGQLHVD